MAFHRAETEKELTAEGLSREDARYATMRRMGNEGLLKERTHGVVAFGFESTFADIRYAVRRLIHSPAFTVVMVLTLGLSIGANSAIFSVIDGVMLKALPDPRAERLFRIFLSSASYPKFPLTPFDFRDYRARSHSFESMAIFT